MAITRTLTKKSVSATGSAPTRRSRSGSVLKNQISSPIELISTTNMITYTSPNLPNRNSGSSASSPVTPGSASPKSATFPVNFFPENPISPRFANPNFNPAPPPPPPSISIHSIPNGPTAPIPPAPPSPMRSPSSSTSSSRSNSGRGMKSRSSGSLRRSNSSHPFGAELAKVSEIAEEYGARDLDAVEEEWMMSKGLRKFGVEDYLQEIAMIGTEISGGWI